MKQDFQVLTTLSLLYLRLSLSPFPLQTSDSQFEAEIADANSFSPYLSFSWRLIPSSPTCPRFLKDGDRKGEIMRKVRRRGKERNRRRDKVKKRVTEKEPKRQKDRQTKRPRGKETQKRRQRSKERDRQREKVTKRNI